MPEAGGKTSPIVTKRHPKWLAHLHMLLAIFTL